MSCSRSVVVCRQPNPCNIQNFKRLTTAASMGCFFAPYFCNWARCVASALVAQMVLCLIQYSDVQREDSIDALIRELGFQ